MSKSSAHAAIEAVARDSYGRLIAYLASRAGDVAGAEDALSDAFAAALDRWPTDGIPEKPEAWLLRVARNRMIDAIRRRQVRENYEESFLQLADEAQELAATHERFPDERLKLLFVCAHPAIDPAARTPLMLQTVLGIDAARIASAFLVSPAAMSQRLVRAKNKIRDAAIPFRVPDPPEWEERVSFVLDAIYSAYTTGWESLTEVGSTHHALAGDAITIGRTLVQLLPSEPEAHGLFALMLHCEARRGARYSSDGEFVPLDRQNTTLWARPMIDEAENHLRSAAASSVWDVTNWRPPFNPFMPTGLSVESSIGRRSRCSTKVSRKSHPASVLSSVERLPSRKRVIPSPDLQHLKKFPPFELAATSPIGLRAGIF
jgi:RNA polymerase sigma factor (sigma-70 family)